MLSTIIKTQDLENQEWIWDFLESQRRLGITIWRPYKEFNYNGHSFQFEEKLFARPRKESQRGYAYEVMSYLPIGQGYYGTVYHISRTISKGKEGIFQVKDKQRVVKEQRSEHALDEYKIARLVPHLHVKQPTEGLLAMKKLQGIPLSKFIMTYELTRAEKLVLTKALIRAVKEQVIDNGIIHNDLHQGNILVNRLNEQFEVNIIDFGLAKVASEDDISRTNVDLFPDLNHLIKEIWSKQEGAPHTIATLNARGYTIKTFIQAIDAIILAPNYTSQTMLDYVCGYFSDLEKTKPQLAMELRNKINKAALLSDSKNIEPLKQAIMECKELLAQEEIQFTPLFAIDALKQQRFNTLLYYFHSLENKGQALIKTSQKEEGETLCSLVKQLREYTFKASCEPVQEQREAFVKCGTMCGKLLEEHQDFINIHRNSNYIWAEIGVVLCSLIVLYPLVAGINYLLTGTFGFFGKTKAAKDVEVINEAFRDIIVY